MRKIEQNMIEAIQSGKSRTFGNTTVATYGLHDPIHVYLHGNRIAELSQSELLLTLAGWPTATTRSRLNALLRAFAPGSSFYQSKGTQRFKPGVLGLSDREIESSEWVSVSRK